MKPSKARPLDMEHIETLAAMIGRLHVEHRDWSRTRALVEHHAPDLVEVDEVSASSDEAAYYGVRGRRLVRCIVADRVLVVLGHPQLDGDEDHLALMSWCAEWTRDACLQ